MSPGAGAGANPKATGSGTQAAARPFGVGAPGKKPRDAVARGAPVRLAAPHAGPVSTDGILTRMKIKIKVCGE